MASLSDNQRLVTNALGQGLLVMGCVSLLLTQVTGVWLTNGSLLPEGEALIQGILSAVGYVLVAGALTAYLISFFSDIDVDPEQD